MRVEHNRKTDFLHVLSKQVDCFLIRKMYVLNNPEATF